MTKKCSWKTCLTSEKTKSLVKCKLCILEHWGYALAGLFARLWLALIFWKSAATKVVETSETTLFGINIPLIHLPYEIQESTYMLFEYEYEMPYPEILTVFSTFAEILLPIMIVLGFGSRIAALGLFIMTLVIQLTYMHADSHIVWMMVSALILTAGPGRISIDHGIRKCFLGESLSCKKG